MVVVVDQHRPVPRRVWRIETKAVIATFASLAASVTVAVLTAVQGDPQVLVGLPGWAQFLLMAAAPPVVTALGAYAAPHTPRPVLPAARPVGEGE